VVIVERRKFLILGSQPALKLCQKTESSTWPDLRVPVQAREKVKGVTTYALQ
jgi:hypothetical protein